MEEIENVLIERIVRRQELVNERILRELGKILGEIGELTPSEAYTIAQQLKYGESLQKIVRLISDNSRISEREIYQMLEYEAKTNLAFSEQYFKIKGIDFIPYSQNIALQNKVREIAIATINEYRNISRTTGITYLNANGKRITRPIEIAYQDLVDDAIMNVTTGKQNFYKSLSGQLKTIGKNGVQSIEYESGYHRRIDSALRMNLQDGLSQLAIAQQEIVGEQFGNDGWEVTVHPYPAPDHEDIQGHIFKDEEFKKLQDYTYMGSIKDINGRVYLRTPDEHIRPIGELNCYHYAMAIVTDIAGARYSQKELDKINADNKKGVEFEGKKYTLYEATQRQRQIETEIRRQREKRMALNSAYKVSKSEKLKLAIDKTDKALNNLYTKYHELSSTSGLPTKLERTRNLTRR